MYGADDLGRIQAPALIATGELDPGSTPQMAREMAERIPMPKWRYSPNNGT